MRSYVKEEADARGGGMYAGWRLHDGQLGSLLLEVAVVLAALSVVGVVMLTSLASTYMAKRQFDTESTTQNILRNQMEYVFDQAYVPPPGAYPTIAVPSGYSVTANAVVYDASSANIELVQAVVLRDGVEVGSLETLRTAR